MSYAEEFLVQRGETARRATIGLINSLKADFEKIDLEQIFEKDQEMGVQFYQGFEHIVAAMLPFKAMAVAGVLACDEIPAPLSIETATGQIEMGTRAELEAKLGKDDEHPVIDNDMSFLSGIDLSSLAQTDETTDEPTTDRAEDEEQE